MQQKLFWAFLHATAIDTCMEILTTFSFFSLTRIKAAKRIKDRYGTKSITFVFELILFLKMHLLWKGHSQL